MPIAEESVRLNVTMHLERAVVDCRRKYNQKVTDYFIWLSLVCVSCTARDYIAAVVLTERSDMGHCPQRLMYPH